MEAIINDEEILKEILKKFKTLPFYNLELGVISSNKSRKNKEGVTNAELLYIHENGSPLNNIPSRPILDITINFVNKTMLEKIIDKSIISYLEKLNNDDFKKELEKNAIRIENVARKIIYANKGILKANSPRVAKAKGGNHPLFDTGQLARSITCRVTEN